MALFLTLGGVASGLPGSNIVGSKDIRDGGVAAADIRSEATRSSELADGRVKQADIGLGAVGTHRSRMRLSRRRRSVPRLRPG